MSTGSLTALFYGRKQIPGAECGSRVRLHGTVGFRGWQAGNDQPDVRAAGLIALLAAARAEPARRRD